MDTGPNAAAADEVEADSGHFSIASSVRIKTSASVDYETKTSYGVTVNVTNVNEDSDITTTTTTVVDFDATDPDANTPSPCLSLPAPTPRGCGAGAGLFAYRRRIEDGASAATLLVVCGCFGHVLQESGGDRSSRLGVRLQSARIDGERSSQP